MITVQLIHKGIQKKFKNGYFKLGEKYIRKWNEEGYHYRKFIRNNGEYVDNILSTVPLNTELFFWGEWEGYSYFAPYENTDTMKYPNGIHEPFHFTKNRSEEKQNTDPYIFGDTFKYCICKQNGKLYNVESNSLILFGTVYPKINRFYIDTVYVVKDHVPASQVYSNCGNEFSKVYIEETLDRLGQYLGEANEKDIKQRERVKLYSCLTWWDNKEYFSYVPCKLDDNNHGFERFYIELDDSEYNFKPYSRGKYYLEGDSKLLWRKITLQAINQGFKLGIRFTEPEILSLDI